MSRSPRTIYTDAMILAMCDAPWNWAAQLRDAAKQRKLGVTSVTPITDVVSLLRMSIGGGK